MLELHFGTSLLNENKSKTSGSDGLRRRNRESEIGGKMTNPFTMQSVRK